MTPSTLLAELWGRGISVTVSGAMLHLEAPRGVITEEIKTKVLLVKPELLAHLNAELGWRVEAMSKQARLSSSLGFWPVLSAKPGPAPEGCCSSCAEPLHDGERFRCALCLQAVAKVLAENSNATRWQPPAQKENA